jgi:hydrogenase nickel incorporation protein HypB
VCDTCGCNVTRGNQHLLAQGGDLAHTSNGHESVEVLQGLLDANDREAQHNRQHLAERGVLAINLMSSPGAGKTALLEATIQALQGCCNVAVIVGDLETENDAERIRRHGVPAIQISTGSACHLDAHMVHSALHELELQDLDIVFIENVGNLVCPASFDLGQHFNVTLLSSPEGDDKPQKYPVMFRAADLVLLTKSDLTPLLGDFDPARAERCVRELASTAPVIAVSSRSGQGMTAWLDWLEQVRQLQAANISTATTRPEQRLAHRHEQSHDHSHD